VDRLQRGFCVVHEAPLIGGWQRACQPTANHSRANHANRRSPTANCGANRCQPSSCAYANRANPSPIGEVGGWRVGGRCMGAPPMVKGAEIWAGSTRRDGVGRARGTQSRARARSTSIALTGALARHQSPQQGRCLRPRYWGGWRRASDGERVGESRFCRKVTGGPHAPEAVTCSATLATRPISATLS
jgi:hypothetical protein